MRAYLNGMTAGVAPPRSTHVRAKKTAITGWSPSSVRRHTSWLYSIDAESLGEHAEGFALTLTLRDCPASPDEWVNLLKRWMEAVMGDGAVRLHWVVEWQRRGVPHLHAAVYYPEPVRDHQGVVAISQWLTRAEQWGPLLGAQHWDRIDGPIGWLQYLSKHAARGVRHYQRTGAPEGWARTGRLWGHRGDWPAVEPARVEVPLEVYWRYRRLLRGWARGDAARRMEWRRHAYSKRMLACPQRGLSTVRGVNIWVPLDVSEQLLALAAEQAGA